MNKKFYIVISALFLVLLTATINNSQAAPGNLDPTFGINGEVFTPIGTNKRAYANAVAVQTDGKIVAAGYARIGTDPNTNSNDFAVVRYNPDGSLDTTFGVGGIVTTDLTGFDDVAFSMAIQSDGKIVAAGLASTDPNSGKTAFGVVRYNTNGSLDTSFGGDGIVTTGAYHRARCVALQSDGKIVVAGQSKLSVTEESHFTIIRYNTDGSPDATFDTDGIVITPLGSRGDFLSLAIQPDGKIVAAGAGSFATTDIVIVRYNPNGSLDNSFDTDGKVITPVGHSAAANSVTLQGDGKIVVAGYTHNGFNYDSAVLRYDANGSLDTTFDGDGIVITVTDASFASDVFQSVAIQANGKIVAAGYAGGVGKVVRYKTNGSLDNTGSSRWGNTGIVTTNFTYASSVAIQPDGKVVVAGYQNFGSSNNSDDRFAVARYTGDPLTNTPAGSNVTVQNDNATAAVTFALVSQAGTTTFTPIDPSSAGTLPSGYSYGTGYPAYDITTTATYTAPVTVCMQVSSVTDPATFNTLTLFHNEGGVLVDRTSSRDFETKTICASVTSLSPFVVAQHLGPTAASVTVSGRVLNTRGKGINRARVTMTDEAGATRIVSTNPFGYFRFSDVEAGQTYVFTVNHKRYRFDNATQILDVNEEISALVFNALSK